MSKYILDASALLALIQNEPGAETVLKHLPDSIISSVNYCEVITRLANYGMPENEIRKTLELLGLEIIPFQTEHAYLCGALAKLTKPFGLSLGDRACLALAQQQNGVALTADKAWKNLDLNIQIEMIRI